MLFLFFFYFKMKSPPNSTFHKSSNTEFCISLAAIEISTAGCRKLFHAGGLLLHGEQSARGTRKTDEIDDDVYARAVVVVACRRRKNRCKLLSRANVSI